MFELLVASCWLLVEKTTQTLPYQQLATSN